MKVCGVLVVLMGIVALSGCVQRKIKINSQPEGALVYLNDQEVGRTPVAVNFTWYGIYDVRLEKDGYQPLWTQAEAVAPVWENPPLDLFAEMVPGNKVEVEWDFEMEKTERKHNDVDELLRNAEEMKQYTTGAKALPGQGVSEVAEGVESTEAMGMDDEEIVSEVE
ncbi:PEGA domain protein [Poriferisphaera corsica]|uniref:PEGA domain protein n=2 Tax=Poriferisphaera corsica TaxID=2528020 RepID=A0A517YQG4_9BACT|nr:PEGA domain protein [Poriferisphaera corsica]